MAKAGSQFVKIGTPETPLYQWHCPDWWTFREHDRFRKRWNELTYSPTPEPETLALAWMAAGLEILLGHSTLALEQTTAINRDHIQDVATLANELAMAAVGDSGAWRFLRRSGLVTLALLLAPESGLGSVFVGDFLSLAGDFKRTITEEEMVRQRVGRWRAKRLATALVEEGKASWFEAAIQPEDSIDSLVEWLRQASAGFGSLEAGNDTQQALSPDETRKLKDAFLQSGFVTRRNESLNRYFKSAERKAEALAKRVSENRSRQIQEELGVLQEFTDLLFEIKKAGMDLSSIFGNYLPAFDRIDYHRQSLKALAEGIHAFNEIGEGMFCPTRDEALSASAKDLDDVLAP
jgi:hypothetical protein